MSLVEGLSPSEEHFFKKYLLKNRLSQELHQLGNEDCCEKFGAPFKAAAPQPDEFPLLKFFFNNFTETFPFIASNSEEEQRSIWQDTVQPFLENFNLKGISESHERKENTTKRRQVNTKILLGLLLFFNSMIISKQELVYLKENQLKPSAAGKLEKIMPKDEPQGSAKQPLSNLSEDDTQRLTFYNNISLNIVCVRKIAVPQPQPVEQEAFYWRSLKKLTHASVPIGKHHYEFIIEVVRRTKKQDPLDEKKGRSYIYTKHYINRAYHEFKSLESAMKKIYPGLMLTEVSKLPKKLKNDSGISKDGERANDNKDSDDDVGGETKSINSSSSSFQETSLHREKLRISLRGYLVSLLKFPEIALLDTFQRFIAEELKKFTQLTPADEVDRLERLNHERQMLEIQLEFHQQTSNLIIGLAKDFDEFKTKLVMNPNTITEIFMEIGELQSVQDLSPLLRTFFEWSKLEIAATLYQVFLSQDNSSEWLSKCRKFHGLFPYGIVYGILRFTNPVKIVSKVVDLLLVNIPSINPWLSQSEHPTARNLLSMIFVMLLDEDLSDFEKELTILENEKLNSPGFEVFLERIRNYVYADEEAVEGIRIESFEKDKDIVLTILSTSLIEPTLQAKDQQTLQLIEASFTEYEKINSKKFQDNSTLEKGGKALDNSSAYLNIKQYWQIQIRKRDKAIMKQLWQEPGLTMVIKKFLTIFYQPLMKVFGKSDIHLVFRDFQKFMDDLMVTLTKLSDGEFFIKSSFEIFEMLKDLLDRHEIVFWRFLHNLYRKDDDQLFISLIKWVERFLVILRYKFTNPDLVTVDLDRLSLFIDDKIDHHLFHEQLTALTNQTLEKRQLFKEFLEQKSKISNRKIIPGTQGDINKKWDDVNEKLFGEDKSGEFGINTDDLEDFNMEEIALQGGTDTSDDYSDAEGDEVKENTDRELHLKLQELNARQAKIGTSELDKFDEIFKSELNGLLPKIKKETFKEDIK